MGQFSSIPSSSIHVIQWNTFCTTTRPPLYEGFQEHDLSLFWQWSVRYFSMNRATYTYYDPNLMMLYKPMSHPWVPFLTRDSRNQTFFEPRSQIWDLVRHETQETNHSTNQGLKFESLVWPGIHEIKHSPDQGLKFESFVRPGTQEINHSPNQGLKKMTLFFATYQLG